MKKFIRNSMKKIFNIKCLSLLFSICIITIIGNIIFVNADTFVPVNDETVVYKDSDGHEYKYKDAAYKWDISLNDGDMNVVACVYDIGIATDDGEDLLLVFYGEGDVFNFTSTSIPQPAQMDAFRTNGMIPWLCAKIKWKTTKVAMSHFVPCGSLANYMNGFNKITEYDIAGFKGDHVTNMNKMFYCASENTQGHDISIVFPDDFNAENCTNCASMFETFGNNADNVYIYLGNNFNIPNASVTSMFCQVGYTVKHDVTIDLGEGFNAHGTAVNESVSTFSEIAGNVSDWTKEQYALGNPDAKRHITINARDSFYGDTLVSARSMFKAIAKNGYVESIIIDLGDNFNPENCTNLYDMFAEFAASTSGGTVDYVYINLGEKCKFNNVTSARNLFMSDSYNNQMSTFGLVKNIKIIAGNKPVITKDSDSLNIDMQDFITLSDEVNTETDKCINNIYHDGDINITLGDNIDFSHVNSFDGFISEITSGGDINITFMGPVDLSYVTSGINFIRDLKTTNKNGKINVVFKDDVTITKSNVLTQYVSSSSIIGIFNKTSDGNIAYKTKLWFEGDLIVKDATSALAHFIQNYYSFYPIETNIFDKMQFENSALTDIYQMTKNSNINYINLEKFDVTNLSYAESDFASSYVNRIKLPSALGAKEVSVSTNTPWYGVTVDGSGNETIDLANPITDGKLRNAIGIYTYMVKANLDLSSADATISASNIDIGTDTNRAVTVKYKNQDLAYGIDYELDNITPNSLGTLNTSVTATGKGSYINTTTNSVSFEILAHDIKAYEIDMYDKSGNKITNSNVLSKEEDNTSKLSNFDLVYINPYNGDKVYFKYNDATIFDDRYNEVMLKSTALRNIRISGIEIDVDKTDPNVINSYTANSIDIDNTMLVYFDKVLIKEKQNTGGGSGGSRKKKQEPKVEEPKEEEPKKVHRPLMNGYEDNSFRPNNNLTRAEFAAIIARLDPAFNEEDDYTSYAKEFIDYNTPDNWADNYLGYLIKQKIYDGYGNGLIKPNNPISRGEVSKVLVLFEKFDYESYQNIFSDTLNKWYDKYVSSLYNKGIIDGIGDDKFGGDNSISRAEISKMIVNAEKIDTVNIKDIVNEKNYIDIFNKDWYFSYVYGVSKEYILE